MVPPQTPPKFEPIDHLEF
uniref:Uncharacterized protein n=1 Tax=Arundo donax TaxID=35708 RepID=A0A0A8YLH8_ARUDO